MSPHTGSASLESADRLPLTPSTRFGVWCVEDRAWCVGTVGTHVHALAELPRWQSGEAADVDPARFHYELRRNVAAELDELRAALVPFSDAARPHEKLSFGLRAEDFQRARRLVEGGPR